MGPYSVCGGLRGNRLGLLEQSARGNEQINYYGRRQMIPYSTLREMFRIPWIMENREAIHFLNDIFYLLVALFRARRMRDFCWLQNIFFEMIDSLALYGQEEDKNTVEHLLRIAWFQAHQQDFYDSMFAFMQVISSIREAEEQGVTVAKQKEINKHVKKFGYAFKEVINFNQKDDERVTRLLKSPELMDESLKMIAKRLG